MAPHPRGLSRFAAAVIAAFAWPLVAGAEDAGHAGHEAAAQASQPMTDASKDFEAASVRMHKDMSLPYSNDVDLDFVRGMIPHHQGAIDQAKILLKYSKNPRLRRLAGGIIVAQRREILFMQKWLEVREKGGEMEVPDWLKNAVIPEDVRNPAFDK